jgi:toxin ParE1/3/4
VKVIWTAAALEHLDTIHAYLAMHSPTFAVRTIDRIVLAADRLGDFPMMGRVVPERNDPNKREILEKPYRIIYRITRDVEILAVLHGARGDLEREIP